VIICTPRNEKAKGFAGSWPRQGEKERLMDSTVDCYITSPKSQNHLADNREFLQAGVVMAAPACFIGEGE